MITTISTKIEDLSELWKYVSERHGWCDITPLSGDYEEGIYMATFADDSRILFEANDGVIKLLLTKEQQSDWEGLAEEEQVSTLKEILLYFTRYTIETLSDIQEEP